MKIVSELVCAMSVIFAMSCTLSTEDAESGDLENVGDIDSEIRNGNVRPEHTNVVMLRSQGAGWCTGFLLSRNVIMTAKHCVPNVASVTVEAYRKVGGSFQCLSRGDNTYPTATTTVVDLGNTVCQRAVVRASVARHPDTGDTTSDDIAVLMNPQKTTSTNWVDSGVFGGTQNIGIAVNHTSFLLTMFSFGAAADSGAGAGDLRAGVFTRNWVDGNHMVYKASNDNQVCGGDSGAPVFSANDGNPPHYLVVHSGSDRTDLCADPGAKQRGSQLGSKVPWIRSVTGRSCPELTLPAGNGIGAYCFAR